ncbi:MAG: sugar ABC transporter ATP-binding protein [Treponema sp.]|jgi:ribose transport system ATP-binding protein|nr:sugar ABC transporter ATP-binding protein [Treponema sp.]
MSPAATATKTKTSPGTQREVILSILGISKLFSGVKVLDEVNLDIRRGEIMGLIGENGAGKSTLIKIISGIYQPSRGKLALEGKEVSIPDYITAKSLGIALVPQEFNLINTLTVFENIFLGNEIRKKSGLLDKQQMRELSIKQLEQLKMPVKVNQLVNDLSVAEKQMVEISKALMLHDARILIMDEPTTTLTSREIKTLFSIMKDLKSQGATIIFVSHKLNEVKEICDRVTVLRDGRLISVDNADSVKEEDMARKMVGRPDFLQIFPPKLSNVSDNVVLEAENITVTGILSDVSFSLRKGEILGFSGLVGAGRTELAETVMGLRPLSGGAIKIGGKLVPTKEAADAVRQKIAYLSEDRQGKGVVQGFNLPQNITLISLKNYIKQGFINKAAELSKTYEYVKSFRISAASPYMHLRYLSGGNQQKVYLSRWLDTKPEILILDEPTRGIDVSAKQEIYEFINQLAASGISCIVISSEMEEIIGLCTRVYVMREGRITECLEGNHINNEEIMFHATGIKGSKL